MDSRVFERLLKAKVSLLFSQPWFGQLVSYLNFVEKPELDTAGVNERGDFFYNPKFIDSLTDNELKGLLCHEILHLAFQHPFRVQQRDQTLFNIAADLKVNNEIVNHCTGLELPKGALIPEDNKWTFNSKTIWQIDEKTTEQIYEELKSFTSLPEVIFDLVKGRQGIDEVPDHEIPVLASEWRIRVEMANAQLKGEAPGGLLREIEALDNPSLPWSVIIHQRLRAISKKSTWKKLNKKYLPHYFAGQVKNKGIVVCIAIDTSGSMSDERLQRILTEIWGLARTFRHIRMFLLTVDAQVWDKLELTNGNIHLLKKLKMKGGGGTDFRPVFEMIDKEFKDRIDCLLFFTDGYGDFPEKKPFYQVYWITDSRDVKFPFGKVIYLK